MSTSAQGGRISTIKAWINRRRYKGESTSADDIDQRIRKNWPTLSEEQREEIFQAAWK